MIKINEKCTIIMYHYVRDLQHSRYPNIKGLDKHLFVEQINFLQKEFTIITMEKLISSLNKEEKLPTNAALLTFDDGYIDHYTTVFPELYNRGLQGSFFIPSAIISNYKVLDVNKIHFILAETQTQEVLAELFLLLDKFREEGLMSETNEQLRSRLSQERRYDTEDVIFIKSLLQYGLEHSIRYRIIDNLFKKFVLSNEAAFSNELYLNYEQVKLMKKCGMFFGLHGYDHCWLGKVDTATMQMDIDQALDFWDEIIDKKHWVINYPYGSFNDDVIKYIETQGCVLGLTTEVAVADLNTCNKYKLPRLDTNDLPPKSQNYLKIGQ